MTSEPVQAPVQVLVQRLDPDVPLPRYAFPGDAGADVVTTVDAVLQPGERAVLSTRGQDWPPEWA